MISVRCPSRFFLNGPSVLETLVVPNEDHRDGLDAASGISRRSYLSGTALPLKDAYFGGAPWKVEISPLDEELSSGGKDRLYDGSSDDPEDEYCWKGKSLVISRGVGARKGACSTYIEDDVIIDVFNVRFRNPLIEFRFNPSPTAEGIDDLECLCIVMHTQISLYSKSGKKYHVSLPFVVRQAWPTEFGIVMERKILTREATSASSDVDPHTGRPRQVLPTVFSLVHPHGEIVPIAIKPPGRSKKPLSRNEFVQDVDLRLVTCFPDVPLAVFYNASSRTHCVCWVRPFYDDEIVEVASDIASPGFKSAVGKELSSIVPRCAPTYHDSDPMRRLKGMPFNSKSILRRPSCPGIPYGPSNALNSTRDFHTMMHESSNVIRDPGVRRRPDVEPIRPDVCLVKIWEEPDVPHVPTNRRKELWDTKICRRASKCFLTLDFSQTVWLCLLLPNEHGVARLVEIIEKPTDEQDFFSSHFSCGKVCEIPAFGACSVDDLFMLVVEGSNQTITAYSGPVKIEKVCVNGQLSCFLPDSAEMLLGWNQRRSSSGNGWNRQGISAPSSAGGCLFEEKVERPKKRRPRSKACMIDDDYDGSLSPSSDMLTSSSGSSSPLSILSSGSSSEDEDLFEERSPSEDDDLETKLNVDGEESDWIFPGNIVCAIGRVVVLRRVEEDGTVRFLRLEMPEFAGCPIVRHCLDGLCFLLNSMDIHKYPILAARWYCSRNSPGVERKRWTELDRFLEALLGLMGFTSLDDPDPDSGFMKPVLEMRKTARGKLLVESTREEDEPKRVCRDEEEAGKDVSDVPSSFIVQATDKKIPFKIDRGDNLAARMLEMAKKRHSTLSDAIDDGAEDWKLNYREGSPIPEKKPVILWFRAGRSTLNKTAPLNSALELIFIGVHLMYEELKLHSTSWPMLSSLTRFLALVCHRLPANLRKYYFPYYWRDCPGVVADIVERTAATKLRYSSEEGVFLKDHAPLSVLRRLSDFVSRNVINRRGLDSGFPIIPEMSMATELALKVFGELYYVETPIVVPFCESSVIRRLPIVPNEEPMPPAEGSVKEQEGQPHSGPAGDMQAAAANPPRPPSVRIDDDMRHISCLMLLKAHGVDAPFVECLPSAVRLPILQALHACAQSVPHCFFSFKDKKEVLVPLLMLLGRHDLAFLYREQKEDYMGLEPRPERVCRKPRITRLQKMSENRKCSLGVKESRLWDGMDDVDWAILKLRFPNDQRAMEVRKYLTSCRPVPVRFARRPEMSDVDYSDAQERHLLFMLNRHMALSVGRGLFTLKATRCIVTEQDTTPKLCMLGRVPPRNTTIDFNRIDWPGNIKLWPSFHNGVAAGLKLRSIGEALGSDWVVFNRPPAPPPPPATGTVKNNNTNPTFNAQSVYAQHGGFLMAMGINGHLRHLERLNLHDYLAQAQEMVTIGILLGIGADYCGTQNLEVLKLISLHLEAMMVPTTIELDISMTVQNAALISLGMLYMGTMDGHISRVLLDEIGRPPGPEMDDSSDRESYCLSAGLALGMVCLGQGERLIAAEARTTSNDYRVPRSMADTLFHYMVGGSKKAPAGVQKDKYRTPSYQIREGDKINIDVTAPGAILAFGMMFFNTNNEMIRDWLTLPNTKCLLDGIRPDLILLRVLSRGLIAWEEIEPTEEWLDAQVPEYIPDSVRRMVEAMSVSKPPMMPNDKVMKPTEKPYIRMDSSDEEEDEEEEELSEDAQHILAQTYCNIVAGACMAMAMKYAGTADPRAFETVYHYAKMFYKVLVRPIMGMPWTEQLIRTTILSCVETLVLCLSVIMAGTGDLRTLRLCRAIHLRTSLCQSEASYGLHMAAHMAMGLLFLGGCGYSLRTSPKAVALMVASLYPKFPAHSNDNRYHLQPLRHLIAMAAEPRQLIPFVIPSMEAEGRSGMPAAAKARVVCMPDGNLVGETERAGIVQLPGVLPELDVIESVEIVDERFWKYSFVRGTPSWDVLREVLERRSGFIPVQPMQGSLTYEDDPSGFRSKLANLMTSRVGMIWSREGRTLDAFTRLPGIGRIPELFSGGDRANPNELPTKAPTLSLFLSLCFEFITQEKMTAFSDVLGLFVSSNQVGKLDVSGDHSAQFVANMKLWQIKLVHEFVQTFDDGEEVEQTRESPCYVPVHEGIVPSSLTSNKCLVNPASAASFLTTAEKHMDAWLNDMEPYLRRYFGWFENAQEPEGITPQMVLDMPPEVGAKMALFMQFNELPLVPPAEMLGHPVTWKRYDWVNEGIMNERGVAKAEDLYYRFKLPSDVNF